MAGGAIRYMVIDIYDPAMQSTGAIGLELMIHYRIMEQRRKPRTWVL